MSRQRFASDNVDYCVERHPRQVQVIRIMEDLLDTYDRLRAALGPLATHASVLMWLLDGSAGRIEALLSACAARVVPLDQNIGEVPVVVDSQIVADSQNTPVACPTSPAPEPEDPPAVVEDEPAPPPGPTAYAMWGCEKIVEFCKLFRLRCPRSECSIYCLPPIIVEFQQLWQLKFACDDGHSTVFVTGEMERNRSTPEVSVQMYHAVLCAGLSYTSVASMLGAMKLHVPSERHWYDFQSSVGRAIGWCSSALSLWEEQKIALQTALFGVLVILYVDCRWDSSRNGYHGTVPFINMADNRVIEMITLTRVAAGNSWRIEVEALTRGIEQLQRRDIFILEIIHDDNPSVDTVIDSQDTRNSKDLWHFMKNFDRKFHEQLQDMRVITGEHVADARSRTQLFLFGVPKLKAYCRGVQLALGGNKKDLVLRIVEYLGLPAEDFWEPERSRGLKYPELAAQDLGYKLMSWCYTCCRRARDRGDSRPEFLCFDIINAADHWAGDHSNCTILPGDRPCVERAFGVDARYEHGCATHLALKDFLVKHITPAKMRFYIRARENFMSETFHSVINKFASKRIHWDKSHEARLACAAMDWNENIRREVVAVYPRCQNDSSVRHRPATNRVLVRRTSLWKDALRERIFDH